MNQIEGEIRSSMAKMGGVIRSNPANIHAIDRLDRKLLYPLSCGIENTEWWERELGR